MEQPLPSSFIQPGGWVLSGKYIFLLENTVNTLKTLINFDLQSVSTSFCTILKCENKTLTKNSEFKVLIGTAILLLN
jgi:hypothetical protein